MKKLLERYPLVNDMVCMVESSGNFSCLELWLCSRFQWHLTNHQTVSTPSQFQRVNSPGNATCLLSYFNFILLYIFVISELFSKQLLILKLFWQKNAIQDLTKEFAAAALSNQYIRVLGERRRNNPGNAFMRNFSAGGKSGLFSGRKKSLVFLPLRHLQLIILRLNHTSCQLITFSKQRLNLKLRRSVERVCHVVWIQISVLQWLNSFCFF